ncbi:MAG: type I-U CRISPR-associated protein Csx17 [Deltaproteobacteria bacterium]|nr:type I-U CRISPR-associated protein Csx17 [Deltaproteobacteria bacterium]
MNDSVHRHELGGCSPTPLAGYLKSLGILRLVSEQADATARGAWRHECFTLWTRLDREALERFFLEQYAPTPVVTPWNGGSGFYPKDNKDGIDFIESSTSSRFAGYRDTIRQARKLLSELNLAEKPDAKHEKPRLLAACRGSFSDTALDWLDAAYVLGDTDPKYPPVLGTGGNEGRLEFANNLMQRLSELLDAEGAPQPPARAWLWATLWGQAVAGLRAVSVGQFQPGAAGGPNAAAGYEGKANVNPWDFVLMIEGALMLGGSAVRRYDVSGSRGRAAFPFAVGATASGYASAASADEGDSRGELWLPLWSEPTSAQELRALMGEGRADIQGRRARTGLDFAQAVSSLGVDRGIESFERYGFHVRNGLSYFATTLGRYQVGTSQHVGLLRDLDTWLDRNRGKCAGDTAPASVRRALRRFETAAMLMASRDDVTSVGEALLSLGSLEAALGSSLTFCSKSFVPPLPPLRRAWIEATRSDSPEMRLADALASVADRYGGLDLPIRSQVEPVERRGRFWTFAKTTHEVLWHQGSLVRSMNSVFERRVLLASTSEARFADRGRIFSGLGDIDAFILGRTDDKLLERWFRACLLLERPEARAFPPARTQRPVPYAGYGLPKLTFAPGPVGDQHIPITPRILRLMRTGRAVDAMQATARRLRASGLAPTTHEVHADRERMRRCAAALLFPISHADTERLAGRYLSAGTNTPLSHQPTESP